MINNYNNINDPVFGFETVSAPLDAEIQMQNADKSWWERNLVLIIVALAMAAMDAMFLWDMLDYVMVQNATLGAVGSMGIALILNLIPLTLAKQINNARYELDTSSKIFAIIAATIFALLYASVVALRFHCLELYTSNVTDTLVNTVVADTEINTVSEEAKSRAIMTALLLSIEPLATSGFSFVLAILTDNPLRNKIAAIEKRLVEIKVAKNKITTAMASMFEDKEFLLENDKSQFDAMNMKVLDDASRLKAEARMILAQMLGDASAITHLSSFTEERKDENDIFRIDMPADKSLLEIKSA